MRPVEELPVSPTSYISGPFLLVQKYKVSKMFQLEILRRAGAMPISSRRCGMITKREAERLCKSFLGDNAPPKLPENFAFEVREII
jgi:hypothetical protein